MIKEKTRYSFLEGVRGIAAFIVVLSHIGSMFFTGFSEWLFDNSNFVSLSGVLLSALAFFMDGEIAVYIFWFMSAYVICIKLFDGQGGHNYIFFTFSKRYFRLVIPVLGSVLLGYVLLRCGLMYNVALAHASGLANDWLMNQFNFEPDFFGALKSGVWNTFFDYKSVPTYNSSLWTMSFELYGSFFCFALIGIVGMHSMRWYLYGVTTFVCFFLGAYWLCSFLLGLMLCDYDHAPRTQQQSVFSWFGKLLSRWYVSVPVLFVLIVIGGRGNYFDVANLIVSAAIVFVISRSAALRGFFEVPLFLWLGRISFSLYLLHVLVLCSLSCYLFLVLDGSYGIRVSIASAVGVAVSLLAAWGYMWVDDFAVRFSNRIGRYFAS